MRNGLFAAMALMLAGASAGRAELPTAEPLPATDVEVIKTKADSSSRMTVPVRIGQSGTYQFVIDTGSQTSVLSTDLAMRLALAPARKARIVGIGGSTTVNTAYVEEMGLGRRSLSDVEVALLEAHDMGADGIVGIDSLQQQRVLLDFQHNLMSVGSGKSLGGDSGFEIVVTAHRRRGQLIMTNAVIDGINADVIIDTGADTSIGNRALQRALSRRAGFQQITLLSVTGQEIVADLGFPRKLSIGEIDISNLLVAYADAPVFGVLDLEHRPALMLGMRELRLFKRVAIDFGKHKVYFDLPKAQ